MANPITKKGALGIWMLTALVTGNVIGSGVFLLPASLASFGSISIIAWILTSIGAILLALVFANLSRMVPKVGGPYAYCRAGLGNFIGFQIAYNYWIALWIGNTAIVVGFTAYLGFFWPALNHDPLLSFWVKVATIWCLTLVNIFGVARAGALQLVTTVLKILPLAFIILLGFCFFNPHNLAAFNISHTSNFNALSAAAALTMWSYIGLESATVPADDASETRLIGRATILGTSLAALIYILSTIAIMGLIPADHLAASNAPFADAATIILQNIAQHFGWNNSLSQHSGYIAGALIAFGASISCFGALNGWTLLQGQIPLAAARDHLFPLSFAKMSRFGTPIVGITVSSLLMTGLLFLTINNSLLHQFNLIILLATLASVIPYYFTCFAELNLLLQKRAEFNKRYLIKNASIAIFASLYAFWAIAGSGSETIFYGTLLFLSGLPVYIWLQWSLNKKYAQQTNPN